MDIHQGEFVYASKGRDAGECFIVISSEDNYLYLCNGKTRKVSSPKKKKIKHQILQKLTMDTLWMMMRMAQIQLYMERYILD